MLKMKKRGDATTLNKFILAVIVGFALLVLAWLIVVPFFSAESDRDTCRLSVDAKSATKVAGQESDIFRDLKCKTQYVEVTDKVIKKNDKTIATLSKNPDQKVKKAIADEMYDCWYEMGEGQRDPWGDWDTAHIKHCVICSELIFTEQAPQKFGIIKDFDSFLCNTNVPGKDYSYCRYLTGKDEYGTKEIDASQQYSVVYVLSDVTSLGTITGYTTGGCIAGVGIGAVFGVVGAIPGGLGGCVGGAITGVWESTFGDAKTVKLQAVSFIAPTKTIDQNQCDQLY